MSSSDFAAHCLELLQPLGAIRARRMFGGHGLYLDDLFVGLIAFDRLYLKTDDVTRPRFEAAGCEVFRYERGGELQTVPTWWGVPEEAMDSPALLTPWARLAVEAALRARAASAQKIAARKTAAKKAKPARKAAARKAVPTGGKPR